MSDENENITLPDPLTVAFPNLLKVIPEGERVIHPVTFRTIPGYDEITELITVTVVDDEPMPFNVIDTLDALDIDAPIAGDDTIGEVIAVEHEQAQRIEVQRERERGYRGRRRAPRRSLANVRIPFYAILAYAGICCLAFGGVVQLYYPTNAFLVAVSIPALILGGASLTLAIVEKPHR